MEQQVVHKKKRDRSPGYPAMGLKEAIDKVTVLFNQERMHFAPIQSIAKHWGYTPTSGKVTLVMATLKKYGLIEDQGSGSARHARVSELARKIILDDREDSSDRLDAIQTAALLPRINREVWQEFDGVLPSNDTLLYKLQYERGFTRQASAQFIKVFKRTIDFARLQDSDMLTGYEGDKEPFDEGEETIPASSGITHHARQAVQRTMRQTLEKQTQQQMTGPSLQIPLPRNRSVTISASTELSESEWVMVNTMINAAKIGFIKNEDEELDDPLDD